MWGLVYIYILIGLAVSLYIWKRDYEEEYEEVKRNEGNVEDSMAIILLLIITMFWPIVIIYKTVKHLYTKL